MPLAKQAQHRGLCPRGKPFIALVGGGCQDRTRAELEALLDGLERAMPAVVEANPDPVDFWPVFSEMADVIEESASPGSDAQVVHERIDALLAKHGFSMLRIDVNELDTGE